MGEVLVVLLWIAVYAFFAFCLQTIAAKTNTANAWLAWIPIANLVLMCQIAGKPVWWLILFLIPFVNIIILLIVWMAIAEACKKPSWIGVLMIVPLANLAIPAYLAFAD